MCECLMKTCSISSSGNHDNVDMLQDIMTRVTISETAIAKENQDVLPDDASITSETNFSGKDYLPHFHQ